MISIHALREEGDIQDLPAAERAADFNPRPPRGGRRKTEIARTLIVQFQSTPSARRATGLQFRLDRHQAISIHALREEGDRLNFPAFLGVEIISIHALREEGDG